MIDWAQITTLLMVVWEDGSRRMIEIYKASAEGVLWTSSSRSEELDSGGCFLVWLMDFTSGDYLF